MGRRLRRSSSSASRNRRNRPRANAPSAEARGTDPPMQEVQETFLSHLIELRERLVRSLIARRHRFMLPALYFSAELYDLLAHAR